VVFSSSSYQAIESLEITYCFFHVEDAYASHLQEMSRASKWKKPKISSGLLIFCKKVELFYAGATVFSR
jgi:hypothetical protein